MAGAESILRQVCSRAFGYRLNPDDGSGWTLRVEWATDEGWRSRVLAVDPAELSGSLRDAHMRDRLAVSWASQLRAFPGAAY